MSADPFVALEFPPWIVWGQRRGASVDNAKLAALYPDHRRWVRDEDAWKAYREHPTTPVPKLGKYVGAVRRCGWCAKPCEGRRTAWCSDACSDHFYRVWSWGAVSKYVAQRDGFKCQRCGVVDENRLNGGHYARLQCDHIVPVKDGGTDDPANLRSLCHDCHVAVGYEQRHARRNASAPELPVCVGLTSENEEKTT